MTTNLLSVIEQQHKALEELLSVPNDDSPESVARCILSHTKARKAIAAGKQALEQTQGEWKHCSPELLASGVSCKDAPRRPCECEHGGSHDHWITHPQATEPAPSCTRCGATTGQACNDMGCGYLEAGNGEPAPDHDRL